MNKKTKAKAKCEEIIMKEGCCGDSCEDCPGYSNSPNYWNCESVLESCKRYLRENEGKVPKMNRLKESDHIIHKTAGLLNYLGGNFNAEDLAQRPFGDIVDTIIRNGGMFRVAVSKEFANEHGISKKDYYK